MGTTRTPLALRIAAALAVPPFVLAGLWLFAAVLAPSYWWSVAAAVTWFVVAALTIGKLVKPRPDLRLAVRVTLFATVAVVGGWLAYTSTVTTTVDEAIVRGVPAARAAEPPATAAPDADAAAVKPEPTAPAPTRPVELASGAVRSLGHSASGRAALVERPDGTRVVTLEDFSVDPGPMVEVWLVAGPVDGDADATDPVELGGLKGSRGNQQYEVPQSARLPRRVSVVIWCVPFSTVLAAADLEAP